MPDIQLLPLLESSNNVQEAAGLIVPSNEPTTKELSVGGELKCRYISFTSLLGLGPIILLGMLNRSSQTRELYTPHIGYNLFGLPSGTIVTPTVHTL